MTDKLKPCPFCNSEKDLFVEKSKNSDNSYRICCLKCGLRTDWYSENKLKRYWNMRCKL